MDWINSHGLLVIISLLVLQNALRALPEPDPAIKTGFGSSSPGYKYLYGFATAMKGDISAVGIDPKMLTQRFVKKDNGTPQQPAEPKP